MLAGLLVEHASRLCFLLGVAGLNVHRFHEGYESQLSVREFVDQATDVEQSRVAMGVGRVIVIVGRVVGFQSLLHRLMTEKPNVEPMASLKEPLGCADVLVYVVEPLLYNVFSCHIRVDYITIRLQSYKISAKLVAVSRKM